MDDDRTIARFLGGDPEVVSLIRSWIRAAMTQYRSRLAAELEDLEQEILLDLTTALREDRFRGESSLQTYVRRYAHHKCIDRMRAASRRSWLDIAELELPSAAPSAFEELQRSQSVELALRVLEEMSAECRELWQLLEQGMRYSEMSHKLGVSEGTLRARVLRCRRRALELRSRLLASARGR